MSKEIEGIQIVPVEERTISAAVMTDVAKNLAQDGFQFEEKMLGKSYVVGKPRITPLVRDGKTVNNVSIPLKNNEGTVYIPIGVVKNSRILGKDVAFVPADAYKGFKNTVLRPKALDIWANSSYFHTEKEMDATKEFQLPAIIHIAGAVIKSMPDGTPRFNPFRFAEYTKVFRHYTAADKYPSWDEFCAELKKDTNRIEGLDPAVRVPKLIRAEDAELLSAVGFTLILKDVPAKGE